MNKKYYTILSLLLLIAIAVCDILRYKWHIYISADVVTAFILAVAACEWLGLPYSIDKRYRGTQIAREFQKENAKWITLFGLGLLCLTMTKYFAVSRSWGIVAVIVWIVMSVVSIKMAYHLLKRFPLMVNLEAEEKEKPWWLY